ncbi:hypothetical protein PMAYCL1PPCAC_00478, partial [Pristionchus mayeri]
LWILINFLVTVRVFRVDPRNNQLQFLLECTRLPLVHASTISFSLCSRCWFLSRSSVISILPSSDIFVCRASSHSTLSSTLSVYSSKIPSFFCSFLNLSNIPE